MWYDVMRMKKKRDKYVVWVGNSHFVRVNKFWRHFYRATLSTKHIFLSLVCACVCSASSSSEIRKWSTVTQALTSFRVRKCTLISCIRIQLNVCEHVAVGVCVRTNEIRTHDYQHSNTWILPIRLKEERKKFSVHPLVCILGWLVFGKSCQIEILPHQRATSIIKVGVFSDIVRAV